ncbi:MAG TPA: L-lactate permease [Stellaceae bacterium]|jgi:lactate permease|nr:L-lactate permease [Stellaceae bacterium]
MFHQLLTPVGGNLFLSFLIAALPILTVIVLLGVVRRPAWQASLAGLIVALIIAIGVWQMPTGLAFNATVAGMVFALWPVMWIVFNALLLYNIALATGRFDAFRRWILEHMPNDRRIVLVVIGFCFGALLEGIAGFGTPVAITSALLIMVGFAPLEALTFTLIFNTAPVAFGALGVPITVLGVVTHQSDIALGQMVGRQLPIIALILPFYVMAFYGGRKSVKALFPVLLVAGGSFALTQFIVSNYINYALTDVLSSLVSLIVTVSFLTMWRPAHDPAYALNISSQAADEVAARVGASVESRHVPTWQGWMPWIVVSVVVIIWTVFKIFLIGDLKIPWPGLDKAIAITLYNNAPYAAVWDFQPLATGTAILVSAIIVGLWTGIGVGGFFTAVGATFKQAWIAIVTVALILGVAYLMNYSGMNYTLGLAAASVGLFFPIVSAFLGWVAVFLSGSDTSGNALFGNLQVVAAHQLNLNPILIAATNSSGGVMGKMISPQNIATGVSVTDLKGQEGVVFSKTFKHSIIMTIILAIIVLLQQYVFHWMIPS